MSLKNLEQREQVWTRKRRSRRRRRWRKRSIERRLVAAALIGVVVVLGFAGVALAELVDHREGAGEIYSGVEVGGVDLGGKTPAEAQTFLREHVTGFLREIRLDGPGEADFTRSAREMGVDFDVDGTVRKAYAVGREGNVFERVSGRLRTAFGSTSIPPEVDYRPEVAREEIEEIAARLDHAPRDASLDIEGSGVRLITSHEGYRTDVRAMIRNVERAVERMRGEVEISGKTTQPGVYTPAARQAAQKARAAMSAPLTVSAGSASEAGRQWSLTPAQVGARLDVERASSTKPGGDIRVSLSRERLANSLKDVVSELTVEPVEAGYSVEGAEVVVEPGRQGQSVELEKLLDSIESSIFDGASPHHFQVPLVVTEPTLTTDEAERVKPEQRLASYDTNYMTYDDSAGRVANLQKASNVVDGTLLAPGETFSFNELAAPLSYANTKVIINGQVQKAEGGGLCQVSSTLYMAANYAGLDVIERYPHYAELPYIRPGFDATVWFGTYDMQFVNTTDDYVLVRESVDTKTGEVRAEIWGQPTGRSVKMKSKKIADTGSYTRWITYQTVTENGKVIQDGVLHKDVYRPLQG